MKTTILFFLTILSLVGCSKDSAGSKADPTFQLPPETQSGANTFGVTINGKVYIPRDPKGVNFGAPAKAVKWLGSTNNIDNELIVVDGASTVGFKITLHIQHLYILGIGRYILEQSNFQDGADSVPFNHIFFKIWDSRISNYAYYGSIENQGEINILRNDKINFITSGNFKGKFVRYDNPNEFITITDGRFDIGPGLYDKVFP